MEGKARVNGVDLWYRVTGEGEPVVQIHGAGFGHFNFAPATPELAKSFRVVDFDMRGYGSSDRPLQHYDMEVWADDVAGLMDALEHRDGAHPRHLDGRNDRDRLRRQVPGADDLGRHQLRRREARRRRAPRLQELDRHRDAGPRRPGQPDPRRADRLAGAVEGVSRDAGRRRRDRHDPADPPRLEPARGLHRRVPGDVRHGHPPMAAADHVARARARRRRGSDDPVGPGARRCRPAGDLRRDRERREARDPRLEPLDDLRQHGRAQPGRDRLLQPARPARARRFGEGAAES